MHEVRVLGMDIGETPGNFILLLEIVDDPTYKIPMIIGAEQAVSISISLNDVVVPRPLTHDLFTELSEKLSFKFKKIEINDYRDGIFKSDIFIESGEEEIIIDSRPSDAIAIAIRNDVLIYVSDEVYNQVAIPISVLDEDEELEEEMNSIDKEEIEDMIGRDDFIMEEDEEDDEDIDDGLDNAKGIEEMSDEELNFVLHQSIKEEDYMTASRIKAEIEKRKNN